MPPMPTDAQKWRSTFGYYGLFVCLGLGFGVFGPTIKDLAAQMGTTEAALGLYVIAGSVGYTLGTLLAGRLFDRVLRGHVLLGTAELISAGLLALYPFVHSFWVLAAIVVGRGIMEGMINTGANTLLLWTHGEKASPFVNGLHFSWGLGASIAPFVVGQLVSWRIGYRASFWVIAAFGALISLWVMSMPASPDPHVHAARAAEARRGGRLLYAPVIIAALYLFFYVGGEIAFGTWISTYAQWLNVADVAEGAYLTGVFWSAFTIGRLVSIPVAVWFKPRQVIPAALIPSLVVSAFLIAFPATEYRPLLVASAALGFCLAPIWPTGFSLAGQIIPMTAFASGLVLLGDSLGGLLLPSSAGKLMDLMKEGGPRILSLSLPVLVFGSMALVLLAYLALIASARPRCAPAPDPPGGG
jgi:FHS family Na+ dependent glucose MFS transporter 1